MHTKAITSIHSHLGFGLGLRSEYYSHILETNPAIDWFEIVSENYMVAGGRPLMYLDKIRADYPLVMHGVSLSIGGTDALDFNYLKQLKALKQRVEPEWISDHLCWTGVAGVNLHDLLPLPYTESTVRHVVQRIQQVQDYLGCQILLENVSSYISYQQSDMQEWEFISAIIQQADCFLLLDINNVFVSAFNQGFEPHSYLNGLPINRIKQIHLAGYSNTDDYLIDTHDQPVSPPVWELYEQAIKRFGSTPTMIERDDNYPDFADLMAELDYAKLIDTQIHSPSWRKIA